MQPSALRKHPPPSAGRLGLDLRSVAFTFCPFKSSSTFYLLPSPSPFSFAFTPPLPLPSLADRPLALESLLGGGRVETVKLFVLESSLIYTGYVTADLELRLLWSFFLGNQFNPLPLVLITIRIHPCVLRRCTPAPPFGIIISR